MSVLSIETMSFGETTLISLRGPCDADAQAFEQRLGDAVEAGCRRLVVDLSAITSLDSSLVRALFRGSLELEEVGGEVWLVHGPRLARFLSLIGAEEAFELAGSVPEALRAAGAEGRAMLLNMGASAAAAEPVRPRRRRFGLRAA